MDNAIAAWQDAVKTCLARYADFGGRAGRSEFWWFFAFQLGVYVASSLLGGWLSFLAMAVLLLPALAVAARRLHDTGRSGWWLLLVLIPLLGGIALLVLAAQPGQPGPNAYGSPAAVPQAA